MLVSPLFFFFLDFEFWMVLPNIGLCNYFFWKDEEGWRTDRGWSEHVASVSALSSFISSSSLFVCLPACSPLPQAGWSGNCERTENTLTASTELCSQSHFHPFISLVCPFLFAHHINVGVMEVVTRVRDPAPTVGRSGAPSRGLFSPASCGSASYLVIIQLTITTVHAFCCFSV